MVVYRRMDPDLAACLQGAAGDSLQSTSQALSCSAPRQTWFRKRTCLAAYDSGLPLEGISNLLVLRAGLPTQAPTEFQPRIVLPQVWASRRLA